MIKNVKHAELNINIVTVFFEYTNFNEDLTEYKCLCFKKNYQQNFDEKLKEYTFSNHDNNRFILLLQKGVYPYEYIDDW